MSDMSEPDVPVLPRRVTSETALPKIVPARGTPPVVQRFRLEEEPADQVWAQVTCWCRTWLLRPGVDVDAFVGAHVVQHRRPQYWAHRAAERIGQRMLAWGKRGS